MNWIVYCLFMFSYVSDYLDIYYSKARLSSFWRSLMSLFSSRKARRRAKILGQRAFQQKNWVNVHCSFSDGFQMTEEELNVAWELGSNHKSESCFASSLLIKWWWWWGWWWWLWNDDDDYGYQIIMMMIMVMTTRPASLLLLILIRAFLIKKLIASIGIIIL